MASTTSSSGSQFITSGSLIRMSGTELASGLDTESLIKALTSTTQSKIDRQKYMQDKATWQQQAYQSIATLMTNFENKYLTYANPDTNILSQNFFDTGSLTSSSSVVSASGDSAAASQMIINSITHLATAASYSSGATATSVPFSTGKIADYQQGGTTIPADSYLQLKYNGETYTLKLGADIDTSGISNPADQTAAVVQQLQNQIDTSPDLADLAGKITLGVTNGQFTMTSTDGATDVTVTDGSQNLLRGLGLSKGATTANADDPNTHVLTTTANPAEFTASYLGDTLKGTQLTFSLDGVSKTITFGSTEEDQYDTAPELASYLNRQLTTAFGTLKNPDGTPVEDGGGNPISKASVAYDPVSGSLTFDTGAPTSVLTLASSNSTSVLGSGGVLQINAGTNNRLNLNQSISSFMGADGTYSMTIAGKSFSFDGSKSLNDAISEINNSDAGVTVSYSQTLNTFSIVSKDTGSQGNVSFSNDPLATKLFGTTGSITPGEDLAMNVSINGVAQDITRSSNAFDLDGVDLTVSGTASGPITFSTATQTDDIAKKLTDFVNDYNNIITQINATLTEKPSTDVQYTSPLTEDQRATMTSQQITDWETNAKKGVLQNDMTLNTALSDMRTSMMSLVGSVGMTLSQIGISTQAYDIKSGGVLAIDQTTLKKALDQTPDKVVSLFTDPDGIAQTLKSTMDKYVGGTITSTGAPQGILFEKAGSPTYTQDTLTTQISDYQKSITALTTQLQTEQMRYADKFTAMETALSTLNSQYTYLSSMMSSSSSS